LKSFTLIPPEYQDECCPKPSDEVMKAFKKSKSEKAKRIEKKEPHKKKLEPTSIACERDAENSHPNQKRPKTP
jgi:hypothetical protein